MNDKILSAITLSRKAGKLVMGFDPVKVECEKGKAKLIIIAQDISPKTKKEILRVAEMYRVVCVDIPYSMDVLKAQLGRRSGILAMTDDGFAKLFSVNLPIHEKEDITI